MKLLAAILQQAQVDSTVAWWCAHRLTNSTLPSMLMAMSRLGTRWNVKYSASTPPKLLRCNLDGMEKTVNVVVCRAS